MKPRKQTKNSCTPEKQRTKQLSIEPKFISGMLSLKIKN